jgi:probable O-glycosylation ligase (exosortase A-associated)
MRDALIIAIIGLGTLWSLRQPWLGAVMFAWVSLMSPHVQFGYRTADMPVATGVAVCTMIGLLLTRERQNPFVGPAALAILAFTLWICVTLPFSLFFDESLPLWERSMKIFLMTFVTLAVLTDRRKLDWFIWTIVISIGYYSVKGGVFTLLTGGNYRVWGSGGFISGNNELALAVAVTIPLMRFVQMQLTHRRARQAVGVCMALSAITMLGTYSRGALLAVGAMSVYIWAKGERKFFWGIILIVGALLILSFMPDDWWDRMDTIRTYDQDESALGRINAWWMAWNLAKDRIFGGGFMIYFDSVFARYSPVPDRVHAAHSIYFQVMGEHGFIGLFLFLSIGVFTWMTTRKLVRAGRADPTLKWAADLGDMVQAAMVGYAVAGSFLSLAYFDLPYDLTIIAVVAWRIVQAAQKQRAKAAKEALAPLSSAPTGRRGTRLEHAR